MKCLKCQNDDERYFFYHQGDRICRKCITFQEGLLEHEVLSIHEEIDAEYTLSFDLSERQKELSSRLVQFIEEGHDVLVYAACGCGKTEIILELLKDQLSKGLKIGIAIPRRQVVLELKERLSKYFKKLNVVAVCEGYTDDVFGDLVICTTHQLFRYENYFDIIIVDEPDAFPFYNNDLLQNILKLAYRRNVVYLTATPDSNMKQLKTLSLFRRFHGVDLMVPKVCVHFKFILYLELYRFIRSHQKVMVFVPTIKLAMIFSKLFKTPCIHSKTSHKEALIKGFENEEFKVLITTTIMERGVTFKGVDICVLYANHHVFTEASLIQIAGRVGRVASHPTGEGLFLCESRSEKVETCIKTLNMMNA